MASKVAGTRNKFFGNQTKSYMVRITTWTGGKSDDIELFELILGDGGFDAVAIDQHPLSFISVRIPKKK